MKYDPKIHHRRSIRLKGYDYTREGGYFITICARNRECLFGHIEDGIMHVNPIGTIVTGQWSIIPLRFKFAALDAFVIMPNHFHAIFTVGAPLAGAHNPDDTHSNDRKTKTIGRCNEEGMMKGTGGIARKRAPARGAPTVGEVVGAFKSLCVRECLSWIKEHRPERRLGKLWQRNYWEHIIRDESDLNRIREYIQTNPARWEKDSLFTPRPVYSEIQ